MAGSVRVAGCPLERSWDSQAAAQRCRAIQRTYLLVDFIQDVPYLHQIRLRSRACDTDGARHARGSAACDSMRFGQGAGLAYGLK